MDFLVEGCQALFGMAPGGLVLVCLFVFLAGYVDAIAGGGGLISLPAYLIAGLPTHAAIATNKLSSTMGTSIATWQYAKSGYIEWKLAGACALLAVVGSALGSNLVLVTSDEVLRVFLLVVLPVTAVYVMRSKAFDARRVEQFPPRKTATLCATIALAVGIYDGFYGPGTGTFLMLLLTGVAHLYLAQAAGITKAINLTTNVTALVVFLLHGQVLIVLGLVAGAFNIAGNYLGSKSFTRKGGAIAKPITITVLVIFFAKTIWDFVVPSL